MQKNELEFTRREIPLFELKDGKSKTNKEKQNKLAKAIKELAS